MLSSISLVVQWYRICLQCRIPGFDLWVREIPQRREWQPTPVFLPGESCGQRSLVGYSPRGPKESDRTEWLIFTFIQLYGYATVCLTFHLLKRNLDFFHFQMLKMKHLWTFMYRFFWYVYKVLFLWGKYPVLRLLRCISICLNFKEIFRLIFSQWHYHFLSP